MRARSYEGDDGDVILQLHMLASFPMCDCGMVLMMTSPSRPCKDEGGSQHRPLGEASKQVKDFWRGADRLDVAGQAAAATAGLLSFCLPKAFRRCMALSLARNAAAAITRLMWRCQPCHDRASQ